MEKGARLQSLLKFQVDEPPAKFPSGALTDSDVHLLSPPPHILPDPQKRNPPLQVPLTEHDTFHLVLDRPEPR